MSQGEAAGAQAAASRSIHVVGVGASAGGLDALERFFANVPEDSGAAFVLVQHLSPDFRSLMDEILGRRTRLPIRLVENGMTVEPNHIYLIPPKMEMIISGGRLLLSEKGRDQDLSLPIDVFLKSLAQECGERSIAVILSGGGSDGSRGARAVHEAGGLVLAQSEQTAQFDGMPRTTRDAGIADHVLAPEEMPAVLVAHARGRRGSVADRISVPNDAMTVVYGMLEREYGIDFTHYKPSTVTRRIERRLQLARVDDIDAYVERLKREHEELDVLYRDLLIGVTRFFRNEEAFKFLEEKVLPDLLAKNPSTPFRAWVAGCATGEEVYSLAILLHELAPKFGHRPVKIFATDVHRGSLDLATRATYGEDAVANVTPERLERYFIHRGGSYQIVPDLRQMVVFAPHNVIRDAPFTRVDLISCRNLLIYLQPAAQQKVLSFFHFALNRGGVVLLGPSESPGPLIREYETIDKHWRIYRKYTDVRMVADASFPVFPRSPDRGSALPQTPRSSVSHLLSTYDALLEERMPPSILVNDRGELVHSFGGASDLLKVRSGRVGLDVRDMVEGDLRTILVGALPRAFKDPGALTFTAVRVGTGESAVERKVSIRRVQGRGAPAPHVLITFEDVSAQPAPAPHETTLDVRMMSRDRLDAVEAELTYTKESLQAATEELETSNEELQAANEELLASNEELQSTNEELQSVNEELYSVNAEYQRKITDLTELTNDMENLLSSTDIGTIFLDRDLRIRKFTPSVADAFNLIPGDVGRSIESFANNIDRPELTDELRSVAADGKPIERELRDKRGRAFFLRLLPYRAKGTIDGVVLTLIDVSGLKAAEDALFHERHLLNSLLDTVPDAIYFKDARGRFIRVNRAMAARLGVDDPRDAVGKTPFEVPRHERAITEHQQDDAVIRSGEPQMYCLEERSTDGAPEWDLVTRLPLKDASARIVGVIGILRDVTEQKRAEEKIQEAVRRRDQFLAMLSHELRNPLGAIVTATTLLKENRIDARTRLLQILERQSHHMARLLDDLLDASRVTQNKIQLRAKPVDVRVIAKDAAESARSIMEARGLTFTTDVDGVPLVVRGDGARLLQIQVNLLSNAAKYTPRGGHVAFEMKAERGYVAIRVRDDGLGIHPEMIDQVFELFVQSRRTLDRADGGLGVGLTLVKSLVEMHGGTVEAKSAGEGKGAEFIVRIPLALDASVETAMPKRDVQLPKGARVVVIEDNVDSREALCELLGLKGYECHSEGDGAAGLALIERVKPEVAIVDLGLPIVDGFELARRLRGEARHRETYLIALTGYGQRADREAALRAGFDEHLVKPVDSRQLMQLLAAHTRDESRPSHVGLSHDGKIRERIDGVDGAGTDGIAHDGFQRFPRAD